MAACVLHQEPQWGGLPHLPTIHTHFQNLVFALYLILPRDYSVIQPELYLSCGFHEALELRCWAGFFFCNNFDQLCKFFLVYVPKAVPGFMSLLDIWWIRLNLSLAFSYFGIKQLLFSAQRDEITFLPVLLEVKNKPQIDKYWLFSDVKPVPFLLHALYYMLCLHNICVLDPNMEIRISWVRHSFYSAVVLF